MENSRETKPAPRPMKLKVIEATPENFIQFGQVVEAYQDGEECVPQDAQLDLSRGIPKNGLLSSRRFAPRKRDPVLGLNWWRCLVPWSDPSKSTVKSTCGHFYVPPRVEEVRVFKVTGSKFLKLNRGTWHAGPTFKKKAMNFYNLELSNTQCG